MTFVLADAQGVITIGGAVVGLLGGLGGLAAAVHRLFSIRSENRKTEASAKLDEANADSITQEGWAKLLAAQREALAVGEVENQRLRLDLQAQREANEDRAVRMQRQIDRQMHHAEAQDAKIEGLERAVDSLRAQVRGLDREPVA